VSKVELRERVKRGKAGGEGGGGGGGGGTCRSQMREKVGGVVAARGGKRSGRQERNWCRSGWGVWACGRRDPRKSTA